MFTDDAMFDELTTIRMEFMARHERRMKALNAALDHCSASMDTSRELDERIDSIDTALDEILKSLK